MVRHSPCSPPLLSAPPRRPASLGPPDYSGTTHPIHTAPNDSRLHDTSSVSAPHVQYMSRREYIPSIPQSASQPSLCSLVPSPPPQPSPPLLLHRQPHSPTRRLLVYFYLVTHSHNIIFRNSIVLFRNRISSLHRQTPPIKSFTYTLPSQHIPRHYDSHYSETTTTALDTITPDAIALHITDTNTTVPYPTAPDTIDFDTAATNITAPQHHSPRHYDP